MLRPMAPDGLTFLRTERISLRCGPRTAQSFPDRASYLLQGKALAYPEFETFICDAFPMLRVCYPTASASYDRLDLDVLWGVLRALPDPRLVQRLIVIDFAHDEEAWVRRESGEAGLTIRALTDTRGHIKLFQPGDAAATAAAMRHEWSHLLKFARPEEAALFESLGDLEPMEADVFLGKGQGPWTSVNDEIWARLGEALIEGFAEGRAVEAQAVALAYPIRTALWGRAFARRRRSLDVATALDEEYRALVLWLRDRVEPEVVARLRETAARADLGRAARVLEALEPDIARS